MVEAIAAKPDCDNKTLFALGTMYEEQNNLSGAEMVYRRALQNDPDQPNVLNNLAMILVKKKVSDTSEAVALISKAIKLQPDVPNYYDTFASIQAEKKEYTAAPRFYCNGHQARSLRSGVAGHSESGCWLCPENVT